MDLLKDAKRLWCTKIIATQRGKTIHFPARHSNFLKQAKNFARGFFKPLNHESVTTTYWNDSNAVCFVDNDIYSSRDSWDTIGIKDRRGEEAGVHVPKVASQYRAVYGWVDRCNQQLSYYNAEFRSVTKQSKVLDLLTEMYALVNGHAIRHNSNLRENTIDSSEFRFEIIRTWYAKFKLHNAKAEVLHYPLRQPWTRRDLSTVLLSPRKGMIISVVFWFFSFVPIEAGLR